MSTPSSSARRRNAPNLISPLHRAHGFGVRPASCSATKSRDHRLLELRGQVRDLEREAADAGDRLGVGARGRATASVLDAVEVHQAHVRAERPRSPARAAGMRRPTSRPRRTSPPAQNPSRHGTRLPPGPPVYRSAVIEARFDDLIGVGLVPAGRSRSASSRPRRPDEVAGVIAAAEGAAARGSWVAGSSRTRRRPGSTRHSLCVGARTATRSRSLPLAWFAMFEGRERHGAAGGPGRPRRRRRGCVATVGRPRAYDAAIARDPRAHRGGRHVPGEPHAPAALPHQGDERGLYRDLCYAQRGAYAALPEPRAVPGAVGLTRTVLPHRRRAHHDPADEGNRAPGAMARRGRRRRGSAPRLGEGPRRERDDRRPAPERPRAGGPDGLGHLERRVRPGALRDRVAAHLDGDSRAASRGRTRSTCSARCSRADRSPERRRSGRWRSSPISRTRPAASTAAPSDSSRRRASGAPRARFNVPIRTVVLDAESHAPSTASGAASPGTRRAAGEYDELVAKARVLTPTAPVRTLRNAASRSTRRVPPPRPASRRLRDSSEYFGFVFDEGSVTAALDDGRVIGSPIAPRECASRSTVAGASTPARRALAVTRGPVRVAIDRAQPVDPADPMLFHKTTRRRRLRGARARHPDADDVLLAERSWRDHRVHDRQRGRLASTDGG